MLPFARKRRQRSLLVSKTVYLYLWLFLISFACIILALSNPVSVKRVAADADFVEVVRRVGNYGMVAGGIGTRGTPSTGVWTGTGDIVLDIPATATIEIARIIWTGRTDAYDADGVQLAVDGGPTNTINATIQYEQDPWCCSAQQRHESADITSLILPGLHTYTISDHEHGVSPTTDNLNYGVGIWVVYQDSSEPYGETVVYQGQDSFFRDWRPARGPHTEVRCAEFTPDNIYARNADVIHLISGVDTWDERNNAFRLRGVAFWLEVGNGPLPPPDEATDPSDPPPPALSQRANAVGHDPGGVFPIQSYAGLEWDNFQLAKGINVPAGDTWTCFQIESGDHANLSGLDPDPDPDIGPFQASGMWNLFALRVYLTPTLSIDLTSFNASAGLDRQVDVDWETAAEVNNFGFNLYRAQTNQISEAEKIHFEPAAGMNGGAVYGYTDTVPYDGNWWYWLEDIDTESNVKTIHGPVMVSVSRIRTNFLPLIIKTP